MKLLFLIFHGLEKANGISKKIHYQVKALNDCGVDTELCWLYDDGNHKKRMVDDNVIEDLGCGLKSKLLKRFGLNSIYNYIKDNLITHIYIRYDHNANPFTIHFLRKVKRLGVKIVMEIPTYPYDQEYKDLGVMFKANLAIDKCFRKTLMQSVDKIATFSNHDLIFGRPTICISNGIDFSAVPLINRTNSDDNSIHLIAVATIHPWHGYDRIIKGMAEYKANHESQPVVLHVVGEGLPEIMAHYKNLVEKNLLQESVIFHGPQFGEDLDTLFNMSHIGIGSLARHRSDITHLRSLKNREYAARGIPFIYSEIDDDFEDSPYIMKVSNDETPIDISKIVSFYHSLRLNPKEIRNSIDRLSWKAQMQIVIDNF